MADVTVTLTREELAFVLNDLHSAGHGHGSSKDDFEPECPSCTAADKLRAACDAVDSVRASRFDAAMAGRVIQVWARDGREEAERWHTYENPRQALDDMVNVSGRTYRIVPASVKMRPMGPAVGHKNCALSVCSCERANPNLDKRGCGNYVEGKTNG